jgi:hypothetical protein
MKIRIKGASVRLRLTQTDVSEFDSSGICTEATPLIGGTFHYHLKRGQAYAATLDGGSITVEIPAEEARAWAQSDQVGLSSKLTLPHGEEVALLIEKDFACLAPDRDEDESDMFPNPNSHC